MEGADSDEGGGDDRSAIQRELFDNDDMENEDASPSAPAKRPQPHPSAHDDVEEGDEELSDEDSFIVDDEGKPIHGTKNRGARRYDDAALQEAQDIFGLDFDVEDLEDMEEESDLEGEVIFQSRNLSTSEKCINSTGKRIDCVIFDHLLTVSHLVIQLTSVCRFDLLFHENIFSRTRASLFLCSID